MIRFQETVSTTVVSLLKHKMTEEEGERDIGCSKDNNSKAGLIFRSSTAI